MDSSEALSRVSPTDDDLCAAGRLVAEAGWNQTGDDWRLFLSAGSVFAARDPAARLVATAAAIPYGPEFGWISMVLVTAAWRRRGLATRLLDACIADHEDAGRVPVLDATPAGEHVYVRLGFTAHFALQRWQRDAAPATNDARVGVRPVKPGDFADLASYDREIFGGDRSAVLHDLLTRDGARGWMLTEGRGFLLSRRGRIARQLGPLCAGDVGAAGRLMQAAAGDIDEPIFVDVPDRHDGLVGVMRRLGFSSQRPFRRMAKGRSTPYGDPGRMYALVGPEFG